MQSGPRARTPAPAYARPRGWVRTCPCNRVRDSAMAPIRESPRMFHVERENQAKPRNSATVALSATVG